MRIASPSFARLPPARRQPRVDLAQRREARDVPVEREFASPTRAFQLQRIGAATRRAGVSSPPLAPLALKLAPFAALRRDLQAVDRSSDVDLQRSKVTSVSVSTSLTVSWPLLTVSRWISGDSPVFSSLRLAGPSCAGLRGRAAAAPRPRRASTSGKHDAPAQQAQQAEREIERVGVDERRLVAPGRVGEGDVLRVHAWDAGRTGRTRRSPAITRSRPVRSLTFCADPAARVVPVEQRESDDGGGDQARRIRRCAAEHPAVTARDFAGCRTHALDTVRSGYARCRTPARSATPRRGAQRALPAANERRGAVRPARTTLSI